MSKTNVDKIAELNDQIRKMAAEQSDLKYKLQNMEYGSKQKEQEITSLRTALQVAQAKTEQTEKLFNVLATGNKTQTQAVAPVPAGWPRF